MIARARPALIGLNIAAFALAGLVLLAGCGGDSVGTGGSGGVTGATVPVAPGEPGAGTPLAQDNCTKRATDATTMASTLASAAPGDRICLSGDMGSARVTVEQSGTAQRPIVVLGGGKTITGGITVEADFVQIDGIRANRPQAPGFSLTGNNISVTNSIAAGPRDGDGDGIRFFGSNITIAHNTISDTVGQDKRHADCMQTFATDENHPASTNIKIDSNRCERIDNICLIAEGPNSEAGDGSGEGQSTRFQFTNNFCENRAGQAVFLDDISDVTISNNEITGKITKAFALQNEATGAVIKDNKINPAIGYEVGMDDSSEDGYDGPPPGGAP
ncbi:right-handed parallel beta-helix repeat-containing protein [Pseudonocardia spinosispora]|uniref:right-handed parallel beta-helix repeat-containing protein n=1 Tax=Pseudonocardia spinosispora TaxID=103441 RepID=UPI000418EAAE|nr:right-handed parallel beta-helix repeat-containing protein [Pseudonocardia spinosispora]